jgi:ankyrin repeat protein
VPHGECKVNGCNTLVYIQHNFMNLLIFQAYHGHGDILRLLLPLFSNANIKDDTGKTPLDHASFKGIVNLCLF